MDDLSHLDALVVETTTAFHKSLIEEFAKMVCDPDVAASSYSTRLKAIMEAELLVVKNASG